ncbi:MAG: glycosyltransferase [Magnetococcales bacterium]|nr:glycosyltransferase [Magnetococcales bacterium]
MFWKPSWCGINNGLSPDKPRPGLIIVIPCHDEPDLISTLDSLAACHPPGCWVVVRVVINGSILADDAIKRRNRATLIAAQSWIADHPLDHLTVVLHNHPDLPAKHAGVGLARKIGMDAAALQFKQAGYGRGPIVCLDADCQVAPNYLQSLANHFYAQPKTTGCSIHYEHPLVGLPAFHRQGIAAYELYLRYYRQGLRWAGHPSAFHTVGSSMAVRADIYSQQGGMNRRKAGEDFYFLQKIMALGGFTEIVDTRVMPSPRQSNRVPFGTGRAMAEWLEGDEVRRFTYDPRLFHDLKPLFEQSQSLYKTDAVDLSPVLMAYLDSAGFSESLDEMRANTTTPANFQKKFFHWFTLFRVLKFIHWATEHHYEKIPLEQAVQILWHWLGETVDEPRDVEQWLAIFRRYEIDRPYRSS